MLDDAGEFNVGLGFAGLKTIVLKSLHSTHFMWQIQDFLGESSDLHIIRCPLLSQYSFEGNLWLKEIDAGEDLVAFLTGCICERLVIDSCPGFGDEVLNAMMSFGPGAELPSCAPCAHDISILNCPDFSISSLKKMVDTRRIQSLLSDPDGKFAGLTSRIYTLRLSGRVPDISPEDRDWFKGCISEFSYYPTQ
jgi:hypothetical protein